ncbi:hypothetical protein HN789_07690 [archaeon]|jgi:phosphohistidine swiveling domain-containing protein|nr:hypothetical protein [archaeon]MBT4272955.1 hypothetical protein [archaeon]MBT4460954.1 hypothetical protein [archaeon]MBT4858019.1 hypothetical protein [archaeon]MBT7441099.1 hypothetical protein [archaeon]
MMKLKGKLIVKGILKNTNLSYELVNSIFDYKNSNTIIIPFLNPDYTIILNKLDVIISNSGSALSHLAVVAREYNKSVIILEKDFPKIKKYGNLKLSIKGDQVQILL